MISEGLLLDPTPQGISFVSRYVGEPNIPGQVKRRRKAVYDALARLGTPVLVKHRYNDDDVAAGLAQRSPAFDDVYGATYAFDALSHGVGYCSIETSDDEWYESTTGAIVTAWEAPGASYLPAPRYRGYGPGFLIFIVEPDSALDFFQLTPTGALIKTQSATAIAPWFPDLNDNDLLINVRLDGLGNILEANERYELKMTNPVSVRGGDRRGRAKRELGADGGNRYVLNQAFSMALLPSDHPAAGTEVDR